MASQLIFLFFHIQKLPGKGRQLRICVAVFHQNLSPPLPQQPRFFQPALCLPGGALTAAEFTTPKHIRRVKLRARATGELSNSSLNLEATLKKAYYTTSGAIVVDPDDSGSGGSAGSGGSTDSDNPLG